jgi:hypothetical protein
VLEQDESKPTLREFPVTPHDSLMARMDRLGPAKEVLQLGAVIGNDFLMSCCARSSRLARKSCMMHGAL